MLDLEFEEPFLCQTTQIRSVFQYICMFRKSKMCLTCVCNYNFELIFLNIILIKAASRYLTGFCINLCIIYKKQRKYQVGAWC